MKLIRPYFPLLLTLIIGIIVGSFLDLEINSAIFDPTNSFALFFGALGEYPGYCVLSFFGGYLIFSSLRHIKNSLMKALMVLCGLISLVGAIYYQGNAIFAINGYNIVDKKWSLGMPIACLILLPIAFIGAIEGKKSKNPYLWQVAIIILLMCGLSVGLINVVKLFVHRPRFRWLITQNEVSYHNWWQSLDTYKDYILQGVDKDQFKSFPSGHMGTGSMLLALPYLVVILERKMSKKLNYIMFSIPIIYMLLLAYTRMRLGAHFLSDVSFGGLISTILQLLGSVWIFKINTNNKFNI